MEVLQNGLKKKAVQIVETAASCDFSMALVLASPSMILAVQVTIYTLYAAVSLILLYAEAVLFFGYQFRGSFLSFLGCYLLVIVSMFSIGMLVGGIAPNTKILSVGIACAKCSGFSVFPAYSIL